ncbi:hypothetical protein A8F94_18930 [Bacillus sp. FJAT-27225]|uniref:hypothetical protein n=1 Tax=Bacillus sp. FJAT-27225 TaxID=1743144 RepID=UPI00080C258D|nr:hypothetical protein [Bacillus sp. FJAT-27225]OCA83191.1 hypothetical protein A8F94_18930 [Bacillus sp. FJAT-27225]
MRVIYSVLKEINEKRFVPEGADYGLKDIEFEGLIRFLENEKAIERVLRMHDQLFLKPARLTKIGLALLEEYKEYEKIYPERGQLKDWVQVDKILYSNDAEDE